MVFAPIQHGVSSFFQKASNLFKGYISLHKVYDKNKDLNQEVLLLRQEKEILKSLLRKYRSEEEIQNLFQDIYRNIRIARIIGFDFGDIYSSIIINKGSLDGVKKNMVVLDRNGCLVGRVIGPVTFKEARIQLITDIESGVSVTSLENNLFGILSGESGGLCELKYILSTDKELKQGDQIITTGYDGIFPPAVKVGVIVESKNTTTLFWKISVKPYFDIRNLDRVAVIELDVKSFF
jgi:rod shape-determining protein MreC